MWYRHANGGETPSPAIGELVSIAAPEAIHIVEEAKQRWGHAFYMHTAEIQHNIDTMIRGLVEDHMRRNTTKGHDMAGFIGQDADNVEDGFSQMNTFRKGLMPTLPIDNNPWKSWRPDMNYVNYGETVIKVMEETISYVSKHVKTILASQGIVY